MDGKGRNLKLEKRGSSGVPRFQKDSRNQEELNLIEEDPKSFQT